MKDSNVGYYTESKSNEVGRVHIPRHSAFSMVHNTHNIKGISVKQAIKKKIAGYNDEDWISPAEKLNAIASDNHWLVSAYDMQGNRFDYSASDIGNLLSYVSKLKEWGDLLDEEM